MPPPKDASRPEYTRRTDGQARRQMRIIDNIHIHAYHLLSQGRWVRENNRREVDILIHLLSQGRRGVKWVRE